MKKLSILFFVLIANITFATTYHVSVSGGDYSTIAGVNGATFSPDDQILFNQGETFVGRLNIPSSGTSGHPITFGKYGTGVNPIIDANNANTRCISTDSKEYITIDGIDCKNATGYGIADDINSNHITIQNLAVSDIGTDNALAYGIAQSGGYCTITHCIITNIAAVGINLAGGHNLVTYNDVSYTNAIYTGWGAGIVTTPATAADDGTEIAYNTIHDNGGVGTLGQTHGIYVGVATTNINVHNNIITNSSKGSGIHFKGSGNVYRNYISNSSNQGIGTGNNETNNVVVNVYENIVTGNGRGLLEGGQGAGTLDLRIYNNTFYLNNNTTIDVYTDEIKIVDDVNLLSIKNNIIYAVAGRYALVFTTPQTHAVINNNCLYQTSGNLILYNGSYKTWSYWQGYGFDTNGINANPLFISSSDFHLQSGSPAINAGVDVGLTTDYLGHSIVGLPDIGAYEYGAIPYVSMVGAYHKKALVDHKKVLKF